MIDSDCLVFRVFRYIGTGTQLLCSVIVEISKHVLNAVKLLV